jgi:hypothetical protein
MARYAGRDILRLFRADAALALPALYATLEAEGYFYAIRLPTNAVLQDRIAELLKRSVGRPPNHVRRIYGDFEYQAGSWGKPRRVLVKVEWHPCELFPRVGFLVTNLPLEPEESFAFYNQRGTAEQYIKEGKMALKWTRLACKTMAQNHVRLQLHALAYNLGMFLHSTELPDEVASWSLTSLQTRLIKIGARVVRHARAITFQLAEVAISCDIFKRIVAAIHRLRHRHDDRPDRTHPKPTRRASSEHRRAARACLDQWFDRFNAGPPSPSVPKVDVPVTWSTCSAARDPLPEPGRWASIGPPKGYLGMSD